MTTTALKITNKVSTLLEYIKSVHDNLPVIEHIDYSGIILPLPEIINYRPTRVRGELTNMRQLVNDVANESGITLESTQSKKNSNAG